MENSTFLKKPKLRDVCQFTQPIKSHWEAIGTELWVIGCRPLPDISEILDSNLHHHYYKQSLLELKKNFKTSSDDGKNLEEMFSMWRNKSIYSEVSWNHLIEVLEKLKFQVVVANIKEFLESEKAIKKYKTVEVFEMPTMKTVHKFLHHGDKRDYSNVLHRYECYIPARRSPHHYEESELELFVLILFHPPNNTIKWTDLADALGSVNYKYYDIIGEIISYLKAKGSNLGNSMRVVYKVVTLNDAMKVLQPKQDEWFSIGKELGVDTEYRQQLDQDDNLSDEEKLKAVLGKRLELKSSSPYYWGDFIPIIKDILKWPEVVSSVYKLIAPIDPETEKCISENTVETQTVQEALPNDEEINEATKTELKKFDDPGTTDTPVTDDVYSLLEDKAHNWNGIGRELKVSLDYRKGLKKDSSLSDKDRLEDVLSKWIESCCSPVSWNNIKTVLEKLEYLHLVPKVKKKCL